MRVSTAEIDTKRPKRQIFPKCAEQSLSLSITTGAETALTGEGKLVKDFSRTKQIFQAFSSEKSGGSLLPWFLILPLIIRVGSRAWFPQLCPECLGNNGGGTSGAGST